MKTKPTLLASAILLATASVCFGQPVITNQPQTQTVPVGSNVTFAVGATGTGSLLYQWQKYVATFTDLPNRTNATLLLTNVQTSDTDDYRVVVTDATGTTNSDVASLTVMVPPGITRITNKTRSWVSATQCACKFGLVERHRRSSGIAMNGPCPERPVRFSAC
jgi:hypothetical protein